ncbi:MAG: MtrB/PioB family outer membrane beta-barrel protein [Bryobacteraceae bacterium]
MKFLLACLLVATAWAQAPAGETVQVPVKAEAAAPAKADETAPAPAKTDEAAANPAPPAEDWLTGDIDFGYRFRTDVRGSLDTYRNVVDLPAGPRVFGFNFTIQDPKGRLFDRLDVRSYNWGDPNNTAHLDAVKRKIYEFRFDYRNIAYFNALPSFANPLAPAGFDEQSLDLRRRNLSVGLDLRPASHFVPYLAYDRNSGHGTGVSTWVQDIANEYAVPTEFRDGTQNYRGGLRIEYSRFHVTLEEGGTRFKDDESAYDAVPLSGDRTATLMGTALDLTHLQEAYGIRARSAYSKVLATASPFRWLNLSGQFLYSEPKTDINYMDVATGNFALVASLLFYNGQVDTTMGAANKPHVSGNAGFELHPFRRFRMLESWTTDRYHDSAYATIAQYLLIGAGTSTPTSALTPNDQVVNYNQTQTDLFFDLSSRITLRGGYRYVWGDATALAPPLSQSGLFESGKLNQQVGIGGFTIRPIKKANITAEYEGGSTTHEYFRTSLYDFNRLRLRARYQVTASLSLQANVNWLRNRNPSQGIELDSSNHGASLSAQWRPSGAKWISVLAEYDRSTLHSFIDYLMPPFLSLGSSYYGDNAHLATSAIEATIPGFKGHAPKLMAGGSFSVVDGTRPSRFYQPLARLSLPLLKKVSWNTEWQWYGFNEEQFLYEGFRTHLFQTGLRVSR